MIILNKDKLTFGKDKHFLGLKLVYWGTSQSHKWRWHKTHIDLGIISIYDLPQKGIGKLFWKLIAWIIKPMRIYYHRKYVYKTGNNIMNIFLWNNYKN